MTPPAPARGGHGPTATAMEPRATCTLAALGDRRIVTGQWP